MNKSVAKTPRKTKDNSKQYDDDKFREIKQLSCKFDFNLFMLNGTWLQITIHRFFL